MIKSRHEKSPIKEIDLTGPEGNAFVLMGYAKNAGKSLGFSAKKQTEISEDMRSGDYEHLLEVFEKHFGDYFVLYR